MVREDQAVSGWGKTTCDELAPALLSMVLTPDAPPHGKLAAGRLGKEKETHGRQGRGQKGQCGGDPLRRR